jgi:hypothetical protein
MKTVAILLLAVTALTGGKPPVSATAIALAAQHLDNRLGAMLPADDAVQQVGLTQGTYIGGYGLIFVGSLNLAPMAGISPFHQTISKEEYARIHQKKMERLPKLRQLMQEQLLNLAASLDTVPADDQIAIAIALFSFRDEDTNGIPSQIVMHAPKKLLIEMQGGRADRAGIRAEEF